MKKRYFSILLTILLLSCNRTIEPVAFKPPNIEVLTAYLFDINKAEAYLNITNVSSPLKEVGIVWSEKSNPTISDSKQFATNLKEDQTVFLELPNLTQNKTYYLKAYYIIDKEVVYSPDEFVFTATYSNQWVRYESPTLDFNEYMTSDFSGLPRQGNVGFYKVNKSTNIAVEAAYYQNFGGWDPPFFRDRDIKPRQMRFGEFVCPLNLGFIAFIKGGGYYKLPDGKPYYLRDFSVTGIAGYKWEPQYPGADAPASGFGILRNGYVLENIPNGKLWRFDVDKIQWKEINTVPVNKAGRFLSFSVADRAYVLFESEDWNDELNGFYEYVSESNKWEKRSNFTGENRRRGIAFVNKGRLFYGLGQSTKTLKGLKDIWEYDPKTDIWKKNTDYPGGGNINVSAISLNNIVYMGFGQIVTINKNKGEILTDMNDFWVFRDR